MEDEVEAERPYIDNARFYRFDRQHLLRFLRKGFAYLWHGAVGTGSGNLGRMETVHRGDRSPIRGALGWMIYLKVTESTVKDCTNGEGKSYRLLLGGGWVPVV